MCQDALKYHYRAIHYYTEVNGTKAHQIGRHTEYAHHNEGKKHSERYHRCHYQARTNIAKEYYQHQKHYQRTFYKIIYHGRDVAVHQLGAIEIRLYAHTLGQYFLHLCHAILEGFGHHIGISAFEHHGYSAHALASAVHCHRTEAFCRAEAHTTYIADVNGHTATVCHHYFFYVLHLAYHTLRADIIGFAHLLDVAGSGVLIVFAQGLKHVAYGDLQCRECIGVDGYLILLEVTAETVNLHNAGYARELALHYPILDSAQLHSIVFILIFFVYFEHILIYLAQTGGDRHQFGCTKLGGYLARHGLYLLIHQLSSLKRGHILLKHHCHQRKPEARHRTNLFHIHNVAHRYFHRHCD